MPFPKNAHLMSSAVKPPCRQPVLDALKDGPKTVKEISIIVGVGIDAVSKNLRAAYKQAYICDWRSGAPVWALGDQPHVPRPGPTKKSQVTMRNRSKRVDGEYLGRSYVTSERVWGI